MSVNLIEDIAYLYGQILTSETEVLNEESNYYNLNDLTSEIINTISLSMISEGYSAHNVINFLATSHEDDIIEYYLNCNYNEGIVSNSYIAEQFIILEGGWSLIGKAISAGLKNSGRVIKVATKRMAGPGVRKAVTNITKSAKEVLPKVGKVAAVGAVGAGGGYIGAKIAGAGNNPPNAKTESPKPPKSNTPAPNAKPPGTPPGSPPRASSGNSGSSTPKDSSAPKAPKKAGSAMKEWEKNFPKLAAAKAERDRTRGTKETPNPLMKDFKADLPSPSPKSTTAIAFDKNTPNLADTKNKKSSETLSQSYEYDAYDLVLEYLLDDGHAATIAEAEYIMTELDSEVINQIVETRLDPRGRPASGPMNVYRDPKGKPDQAHLDAIKSYDEKQKKKTPEQRKKELDAYIARQRNK